MFSESPDADLPTLSSLRKGPSKNPLDPLFGTFSVDSCVRRNDRGSVRFFVGLSFLSRFEADHPTLSFLRKQGSILERSANFSSGK
ncbi:MAG: hypothetical protein AAF471_01865, partial [Myxococcota bacterium]